MPAVFKALIIILSFGYITFWLAAKTLPDFVPNKTFRYWRNLWFTVVIAAFFSHSVWLFFTIIILGVLAAIPTAPSLRITYYFLLVGVLPEMSTLISGFAGIKALFVLSYPRLLIITLFLGTYLTKSHNPRLFSLPTDRYIVALVILFIILNFRDSTITNAFRESFLIFIDIFIPYFIISRYISTLEQMNQALFALFIGIAFLALIGVFESIKHWLVYSELLRALSAGYLYYDMRAGELRSVASFSGPIVLGFVMMIGFGILIYLKPFLKNKNIVLLAGCMIVSCLLLTMARGAWVGLVILIIAYIWTGKETIKWFTVLSLSGLAIFPLLSLTAIGNKYIELIPFLGTTRADTVDYRERLIDVSWIVFQRTPFFGSTTFKETPEMESMRQGQGIIDIVNTYIQIALAYGGVGLILFITIFLSLLIRCFKIIKKLPREEVDLIRLGRSLFAIQASILVTIFTVSSVNYIPIFYWLFTGIIAAYLHISKQTILSYTNKIEKPI